MRRTLEALLAVTVLAAWLASPALAQAPAQASPDDKAAITETIERYFRGLDGLDPDVMSSALHPEAVYTGGVGQPFLTTSPYSAMLEQVRKMRGTEQPPASNAARTVTGITVRGILGTAFVRVEYRPPSRAAGTRSYHAYQLYKAAGRWQIVSGVMHSDRYEGGTDEATLDAMGVRPGMTVGEIGAGDGRITFALARRVGAAGKVWANDIDPKALADLREVCRRTGTANVETLAGKVDDPAFPKGSLDLAAMALVYHHLEQPVALLKNLALSLKPGATVVIVDPAYDRVGEKDSDRPSTRERVEAEAAEAGYELAAMDASLPRDNIFILRRKGAGAPAAPRITTTPRERPPAPDERAALLAAVEAWWQAHDADEAAALERVLAPGARSWYEDGSAVQFVPYVKEIERINGGRSHAGTRPAPGEKRSVLDVAQDGGVAMVTMLVEIPRGGAPRRSLTTFQLYRADDRWLVVNLAGYNEPGPRVERQGAATAAGPAAREVRNSLGMRFVEIPAGSFDMGSDRPEWERPIHRVRVKGFWLGVTEVTQAQWQAVMGSNPSHFKEAGPNAPVEMVSWEDAQAFIEKLNALDPGRRYRLPSEAEWEYACRAGSTEETYGPWEEIAWIQENSGGTTHPVGLKRPNGFGLHDMLGNVTEWAQDTWHDGYVGAPVDGSARMEPGVAQHALRGGGWDLPAFFLHAGIRGPYDPVHRLGFRVAFDPANAGGQPEPPALKGPYLGQTPPGTTPRVFAPGIVSTEGRELNAVFTPDGTEFYYAVAGTDHRWTIMRVALENGRWSPPRPAPFSGRWSDVDMFITADGRRLYFCSNRPLEGDTPKDFDIWMCERSASGWGEPQHLGAPINSPFHEFYPSVTRDGTFYFQSSRPGGPGESDIWRSRLVDGRYADAECLPAPVNSPGTEGDALIAPDESYLIVSASRAAQEPRPAAEPAPMVRQGATPAPGAAPPPPPPPAPGLYLSLRRADGTWSPLVSLGGGINSPEAGVNCQMLSPDGRYLFFTRAGDIFWVDASVIEEARRQAREQHPQ